jgi:hypothetical protein
LQIGQAIAPAVRAGAGALTGALNGLASGVPKLIDKIRDPFGTFQTEIRPRLQRFADFVTTKLAPALVDFGRVVGPAVADAVKSISGSISILLDTFSRGDDAGGGFGDLLIALIPVVARFVEGGLKVMTLNVRVLVRAFKILTFNIKLVSQIALPIFRALTRAFLIATGFIIDAAAKAFGWIPGLGPKLKTAASKFAAFKTQVLRQMDGFRGVGIKAGTEFAAGLAQGIAANGTTSQAVARGTANKLAAGMRAGFLGNGTRADVRTGRRSGGGVNVTVNNPVPEKASESVPKAIRRETYRAGWVT